MGQLDQYLQHMVDSRASDLHISADEPVRMRVDGDLVEVNDQPLSHEQVEGLLFELLGEEERERFHKNKNLDRSYAIAGIGNFRFNFFLTRRGMAAVIRAIPSKVPTMEDLGLPETVQRLTEADKGLILVTGPTGSGKSTTLAAMINHINTNYPYHILTVEDPVEFVHPSKQSLVNQREIGPSCHTFADALKFALREDPDVILVGELRDLETMSLAMTAAETGHLVFGTLHTRGAAASVDRLIDSFPANQQPMIRTMLSESLIAVISQALLKKAGGKGRVAAYEIMVTNHAISNLIREGKTFQIQSTMQTSRKEGMVLMEQYVKDLMSSGIVEADEGEGFLASIGKGEANAKGKMGAPPTPTRSAAPPPPAAPKGFKPEPLEITNHNKPVATAAKPAAKPAAAPTARPAAPAAPPAKPAPVAAKPAPAMPKAPPVAKPAAPAASPKAPPPMASRPPAPPTKPPAPPAVPTTGAAAGNKFAPLSETVDPSAAPRSKPVPPARLPHRSAEADPDSEIPQPTLLTDLTNLGDEEDRDQATVMHLADDSSDGGADGSELADLDLTSLELPEDDGAGEDPNQPVNPPMPKKKAG